MTKEIWRDISGYENQYMERIAQHNTPIGEEVNVSLVYREAVRQYLAGYRAGTPDAKHGLRYPVAEQV